MAKRQRHAMKGYYEVGASWRRDPWHTAYYRSLRVEDGVAVSYSTPIAAVIEGVDGKKYMLETTQKHSPTTFQHQSNLRRPECCDGGVIRAMVVERYCQRNYHTVNIQDMLEKYRKLLGSGRSAIPAAWRFELYITRRRLLGDLRGTRNNALAYITAFGLDPETIKEMQPNTDFDQIVAHHADRVRNEKLARQRKLAHERRKNKLMLAMLTGEVRHDPSELHWLDEKYESRETLRRDFLAEFEDTLAQGDNHSKQAA